MEVSDEAVCMLVRLALANEASKRPLKKDDIISLVLGEHGGRLFRTLLQKTNEHLASVLGMQLVSLPAAGRAVSTQTVAGRRAVNATLTKRSEATSVNVHASANALAQSKSFALQTIEERPHGKFHRQPDRLALLAIVLSLIHLSEGSSIAEDELQDRLNLLGAPTRFGDLADWFAEVRRQKYLTTTKKSEEASILMYSVGPRAMIEFPAESLARFVLDMGLTVQRSAADLTPRLQAAFRIDQI